MSFSAEVKQLEVLYSYEWDTDHHTEQAHLSPLSPCQTPVYNPPYETGKWGKAAADLNSMAGTALHFCIPPPPTTTSHNKWFSHLSHNGYPTEFVITL